MSDKSAARGGLADAKAHDTTLDDSDQEYSKDHVVLTEDYTSSSGSSSEQNTEDESDELTEQDQNPSMRADLVSTGSDELKARLHAILPAIQHANADLFQRIDSGTDVDRTDVVNTHGDEECEDEDEDEKIEYVEMNLALGVLSEQSEQDSQDIRMPKRAWSSDSSTDIDTESVLHNLQGRPSRAKKKRVVEELDDG